MPFSLRDDRAAVVGFPANLDVSALIHLGGLDWTTNILLGIPLAFLVMGAMWSPGGNRVLPAMITLLLCCSVSYGVEFAQTYFAGRVPSQRDFVAQGIGAVIGIFFWLVVGQRLSAVVAAVASSGEAALRAALLLMLLGYIGYAVFPFDIILPGRGVLAHYNKPGTFLLVPEHAGIGIRFILLSLMKLTALMPLGALIAINPHMPAKDGFIRAVGLGLLLSAALLILRIFFLSSGVDTVFSFFIRGAGAPIGFVLWRWLQTAHFTGLQRCLRPAALIALPVHGIILLGARGVFSGHVPNTEEIQLILDRLVWLPFYYDFMASSVRAVSSTVAALIQYVPLGVFLAILMGNRRSLVLVVFVSLFVSISVQAAALFLAGLRPDPSSPLIAILGVQIGAAIVPWFRRAMGTHREFVSHARSRMSFRNVSRVRY